MIVYRTTYVSQHMNAYRQVTGKLPILWTGHGQGSDMMMPTTSCRHDSMARRVTVGDHDPSLSPQWLIRA